MAKFLLRFLMLPIKDLQRDGTLFMEYEYLPFGLVMCSQNTKFHLLFWVHTFLGICCGNFAAVAAVV